jgi:hypothetical protein
VSEDVAIAHIVTAITTVFYAAVFAIGYYLIVKGNRQVLREMREERLSDASTTRPLLLNLLHREEEGDLSEVDLTRCIEMVSGFILRRYVCLGNVSSRAYSRWFVSVCRELGNQSVKGLKSFLLAGKDFPDDARFEQCLLRFKLYQSDYARHVLEQLERSYHHKESADPSNAEIEHIMPQTLDEDWKEDLGLEYEGIHSEWLRTRQPDLKRLSQKRVQPRLPRQTCRVPA